MDFGISETPGGIDRDSIDYLARARIFHLSCNEISQKGFVFDIMKYIVAFDICS